MSILQKGLRSFHEILVNFVLLIVLSTLFSNALSGQCIPTTAYTSTVTTGNQSFAGQLGLRFANSLPIRVSELGVFDDNTVEGISGSITVGIVNSAGTTVAGPIVISGTMGNLNGRFRMLPIAPVVLQPDTYYIVAVGFSASDPNGNTNFGGSPVTINGGAILSFGLPRYDVSNTFGGIPGTEDSGGPNGRYHAGTFTYSAVTPVLSTNINGVVVNSNNNGVDDTGAFVVCNGVINCEIM